MTSERGFSLPHNKRPEWLLPAGLLLLSAVPVAAGSARVAELAGGARVTADNARFFAMPVPVVLHIFGATVFCVLGAFQFVPALRRRRPRWHRVAGRLLVPCGLAAALSGLWMTLFYDLPPGDGDLLTVFRLFFGTAMAVSIVLATLAIRRRDVRRHRVWMTRGYAIGLGAGTQVLTHVPWTLLVGVPGEVTRAMLMAAGWVLNLVVAEWALRRRPPVRAAAEPAVPLG
ncbi:DUF2306 domain-containing protein [Amycolatopsis sp. NPDC051716]|jgi:uncharacterized membrane protein|uniref:DUF2306 domain-containing protein n=1 Tax=Amycolatopsis sp. NPDC051716 TaxID=3155804 RepID=UPI003421353D